MNKCTVCSMDGWIGSKSSDHLQRSPSLDENAGEPLDGLLLLSIFHKLVEIIDF
jgi:hypothetical protein